MDDTELGIVTLLLCHRAGGYHGSPERCIAYARRLAVVRLARRGGMTYRALGQQLGITTERVRQLDAKAQRHLCERYGLPLTELPTHVRTTLWHLGLRDRGLA